MLRVANTECFLVELLAWRAGGKDSPPLLLEDRISIRLFSGHSEVQTGMAMKEQKCFPAELSAGAVGLVMCNDYMH